MRCDGHPDCWDHSDEKSCTRPSVCATKHLCPLSMECLIPEWVCDGDKDCRDGTDEKVWLGLYNVSVLKLVPGLVVKLLATCIQVPFTKMANMAQEWNLKNNLVGKTKLHFF